MNPSSDELSRELAAMSDAFAELGERLLGAARQLHAPGTPPPDGLIEDLSAARRSFVDLRDRVRDHAESLDVVSPPAEALNTIQRITLLLDETAAAESGRARGEAVRRKALAVLRRVTALSHAGSADFAPIEECHDLARQLRDKVADGPWSDLPPEAERLAEGDHPFAHLLRLVEDRDALDDDQWADLHESVGSAFGKPLAAAAARAKLVLAPEALAEAGDDEGGPPADRPSGRRSLGKARPGSR